MQDTSTTSSKYGQCVLCTVLSTYFWNDCINGFVEHDEDDSGKSSSTTEEVEGAFCPAGAPRCFLFCCNLYLYCVCLPVQLRMAQQRNDFANMTTYNNALSLSRVYIEIARLVNSGEYKIIKRVGNGCGGRRVGDAVPNG